MRRGFSLLELSIIIICSGCALQGLSDETGINISAIISQVGTVKNNAGDYVDANRYLEHVAHELQKVNEG